MRCANRRSCQCATCAPLTDLSPSTSPSTIGHFHTDSVDALPRPGRCQHLRSSLPVLTAHPRVCRLPESVTSPSPSHPTHRRTDMYTSDERRAKATHAWHVSCARSRRVSSGLRVAPDARVVFARSRTTHLSACTRQANFAFQCPRSSFRVPALAFKALPPARVRRRRLPHVL